MHTVSDELAAWLAEQQQARAIDVREAALGDLQEWRLDLKDGRPQRISHSSGKYHYGTFLEAWDAGRNAWIERFLIEPIPSGAHEGIYGLALLARWNGKYLVQAKAEPGNASPGHVQVTSTIHSSFTNIAQQRSGTVPFTWMFDDPKTVKLTVMQDGAQLLNKNNLVCFLELDQEPEDMPEQFAWATLEDIHALSERKLVSEHLIQGLGASLFP